jgi:membrane associated rhomboid family serine protease
VHHPGRATRLRCSRCERPACPECLTEAAVGYQCVDCVRAGRRAGTAAEQGTITPEAAQAGSRRRPVVTIVIIGLNVAFFVVTVVQARSAAQIQLSPLEHATVLYPPAVAAGQWWRMLTSGFVHFGVTHIALNMISLWLIGKDLERIIGPARYTALYVLSLLGGSVAAYLFTFPQLHGGTATWTSSGGASGAIFGVLGAVLILVLRLKINPRMVLLVIAANLVISFTIPNISWQAHIGGLISGAAFAAAVLYAPRTSRRAAQLGAAAGLLALFVGLFVLRDAQIGHVMCSSVTNLTCRPA